MIESKDYEVTLTVRLTTTVHFAPTERDTPLTRQDAIDNAIGMIDWEPLDDEFSIAYPVDGEATELFDE